MRHALVTGASSGIGAATARHLVARGFRVTLLARGRGALEQLATELGNAATAAACDAAAGDQVLAMAEDVRRAQGAPDAIVHCAGAGRWLRVEETSPAAALEMLGAPYLAAFHVNHAFLPDLLARGAGVLVHVNSPACFIPWPSSAGYAAARWALRGLHEALSQDLVGSGVRSCHVVFGHVASPYFENNPGTLDKMPWLADRVRTLAPDECGALLADRVERPRREVVHPPLLRFYLTLARVAPGLARRLVRRTGARGR
jgi:short-subunit dehydrogenase